MKPSRKLLVAVDDSEPSVKAVRYVAGLAAGHDDLTVHLFHVLPPIPPELLEFGGAENPEKEQRLSAELKEAQARWVEQAKQVAQPCLDRAMAILSQAGVAADRISVGFSASIHRPNIPRDLLEATRAAQCDTVVVGRHALPWSKELTYTHVGSELVKHGQGVAVLVVG